MVTGRPTAEPKLGQLLLQVAAGQRVERAERLVQEENLRLGRERAGDRHPLAHAARQLAGPPLEGVAEANKPRYRRDCATCCARVHTGNAEATASCTLPRAESHGSSE